eukprot:scaffold57378_cov15-Tisochrysis_lutea.AAC.1
MQQRTRVAGILCLLFTVALTACMVLSRECASVFIKSAGGEVGPELYVLTSNTCVASFPPHGGEARGHVVTNNL